MITYSSKPEISVYIPTFNRLNLLRRAVQSLRVQTFANFEAIIVDDGSIDGTQEYIEGLVEADRRFRFIEKRGQKRGACVSRNVAIENARAQFITGLDDDDWFHQSRLHILMKSWNPKYSCIATNLYFVDGDKKRRSSFAARTITFDDLKYGNLLGSQVFTLKKRVMQIGGFDESLSASQDYDLWLRLVRTYSNAYRLRQPLYYLDIATDRERISTTNARDIGTQQFIAKYQGVFNSKQLRRRESLSSNRKKDNLCLKLVHLKQGGPRFVYESLRHRLRLS